MNTPAITGAPAPRSQTAASAATEYAAGTQTSRDQSTPTPRVLEAARRYCQQGWRVVPIPYGEKGPKLRAWTGLRLGEADLEKHFGKAPANIGVLLGEPSRGLVDVDLDCEEAIALAALLLPDTGCVFGRESKRRSHYFYFAGGSIPDSNKFGDSDGATLLELRSTRLQTVVPPSVHPSGESIRFDRDEAPAQIAGPDLAAVVGELAAATLFARCLGTIGRRHDLYLACAGSLLRAGWDADRLRTLFQALTATTHDDEPGDRLRTIDSTAERYANGEPVAGWGKLAELIGPGRVKLMRKWLRLTNDPAEPPANLTALEYRDGPDGTFWDARGRGGESATRRLANFGARIVREVCEDDGAEKRRFYELEARAKDRKFGPFPVPVDQFGAMGWVHQQIGAAGILEPGTTTKDRLRAAIQKLSGEVLRETVFAHSGWRHIEGAWVYLHAAGGIGAAGAVGGLSVRLPEPLAGMTLPEPPSGEDLTTAIHASLALLKLGKPEIVLPVLAAVYRAALGGCDFSLFVAGPSGVFKTELATLAQQHFGTDYSSRRLPASFASTANAIEVLAFHAKDSLLVVDDFAPHGRGADVDKYHRDADRLFRGVGNHAGRGRMNADGSTRPTKPPRAMIVGTGEDVPLGHSLRSRLAVVEIGPGDIDPKRLTEVQSLAARGLFAQCMAGFVRWVAADYSAKRAAMLSRATELRGQTRAKHQRTHSTFGELQAAFETFTRFAVEATAGEALTEQEAEDLTRRSARALDRVAEEQGGIQAASEPVGRFLELLTSALASGRAHLAGEQGEAPVNSDVWGWRQFDGDKVPRGQGERIGWTNGQSLYLDFATAFKAAQGMAGDGDRIHLTEQTLKKRLHERGLLVSTEKETRQELTIRKTLQGASRKVIHLHKRSLGFGEADKLANPDGGGPGPGRNAGGGGLVVGPTGHTEGNPPTGPATTDRPDPTTLPNGEIVGLVG